MRWPPYPQNRTAPRGPEVLLELCKNSTSHIQGLCATGHLEPVGD
jgi:hypothetical protein